MRRVEPAWEEVMTISRRSLLKRSVAVAASAPFWQNLSVDYCEASNDGVDFSMGFPPDALRLNRNENPLGPSPKAVEAGREGVLRSNRYADPILLKQLLAEKHVVEEEMILVGTGSGELV